MVISPLYKPLFPTDEGQLNAFGFIGIGLYIYQVIEEFNMAKQSVNLKKIYYDINVFDMNNIQLMDNYHLKSEQLIYIFGKLAEKNRIPFKRVITVIDDCLNGNEIEKAERCLRVVRKHFQKTWALTVLIRQIEQVITEKKQSDEYRNQLTRPSRAIEWFENRYPDVHISPAIHRMVNALDDIYRKMPPSNRSNPMYARCVKPSSRLSVIAHNSSHIKSLTGIEITRMWHYIGLKIMKASNVEFFTIQSVMDHMTCDTCMHITHVQFPVINVLEEMTHRMKKKDILPPVLYPTPAEIETGTAEEKSRIMRENGWMLPPFCEECRCQIVPDGSF